MFLDANIFIYAYASGGGAKQQNCAAFMERIVSGEQRATTSSLVINEVIFFFLDNRSVEIAEKVHKNILSNPNIDILAVDRRITELSFSYIKAGMQVTDAFHAATMRINGISTICSYDRGFDRAEGISRQEPR